jgi:hypothetical protein
LEETAAVRRPSIRLVTTTTRSSFSALDSETLAALSRPPARPRLTFPLMLVSVTVTTIALAVDGVPQLSPHAYVLGFILASGLGFVLGNVLDVLARRPGRRTLAMLLLPAAFGALIGMAVQAVMLGEFDPAQPAVLKDFGGLIATTSPTTWIAGGIVLGSIPALAVSAFLLLAGRALRRTPGNDASNRFSLGFVSATGVVAALALMSLHASRDALVGLPLTGVALVALGSLTRAIHESGRRLRLLRKAYAGQLDGVEIVPRECFGEGAEQLPQLTPAGVWAHAVLVRTRRDADYRGASREPVALLSDGPGPTLAWLRGHRATAATLAVTIGVLLFVSCLESALR